MKISVCIPNYNYARYLGRTIESLLAQEGVDLEIVVSDNASTDDSVAVVQAFADPRIRLRKNRCNVGFARNLDRAAELAEGELVLMLSSDDLARPGALGTYVTLQGLLGPLAAATVVTSTVDVIDAEDRRTGMLEPDPELWALATRDESLSRDLGAPVLRMPADALLRRCLLTMKNPFNFAATCYPRGLYERLHGYGGGRLINPDKWFHWRLLGVAREALFVAKPLFAYRWHSANQTAQQMGQGSLKYLVDEYTSTLEVDAELLARANLTQVELREAFVDRDIGRHGLATLGRGDRSRAVRIVNFGRAAYPEVARQNGKVRALRFLLSLGRFGGVLAGRMFRLHEASRKRDEPAAARSAD